MVDSCLILNAADMNFYVVAVKVDAKTAVMLGERHKLSFIGKALRGGVVYDSAFTLSLFKNIQGEQAFEFKFYKNILYFLSVPFGCNTILQICLYSAISVYRGKFIRKVGALPALYQLVLCSALYVFNICIYAVEGTVCANQVMCCFFAYAGNPRNVVRFVAHKRLQINYLFGQHSYFG